MEHQLGEPIRAASVLATYDPELLATTLGIGLGVAGGLGAGGAAVGQVVGGITEWGASERQHYASLPHKVFAAVSDRAVHLFEWSSARGLGKQVGRWERGQFRANIARHRLYGQVDIRVVLPTGKVALLSARTGPLHRAGARCARAIAALAAPPRSANVARSGTAEPRHVEKQ